MLQDRANPGRPPRGATSSKLNDRRVRSALVRYRDESLRELLDFSAEDLTADLKKVREDTQWEHCSYSPLIARAVKFKNRSERQRLEVIQLALDRQLERRLRCIELDRIGLTDWWLKVTVRPRTANVPPQRLVSRSQRPGQGIRDLGKL
ncbi:unnamed protein product [Mesocestoides corti]|uniref:Transposase n=1 Tax=Mesocestoides corti TaxID=53468 RepID=A0A0R3U5C3_MESCO|nr:unnamed protein product [Mesocestoides corti]